MDTLIDSSPFFLSAKKISNDLIIDAMDEDNDMEQQDFSQFAKPINTGYVNTREKFNKLTSEQKIEVNQYMNDIRGMDDDKLDLEESIQKEKLQKSYRGTELEYNLESAKNEALAEELFNRFYSLKGKLGHQKGPEKKRRRLNQ